MRIIKNISSILLVINLAILLFFIVPGYCVELPKIPPRPTIKELAMSLNSSSDSLLLDKNKLNNEKGLIKKIKNRYKKRLLKNDS